MTDMTDNTEPNVEIIGQETPPRLSEDGIAYQKGLLADEQWCEEFPAQAAALRASLDIALAATGQNLEPPPDQRSAAQRLHDQRLGVMPRTADQYGDLPKEHRAFAAALSLPPDLALVIANELSSGSKPDKAELSRLFGDKLDATLKDAQFALDRAPGAKLAATELTPWALGQLGAWGGHLRLHSKSRPA